jgi:hypothetical protein
VRKLTGRLPRSLAVPVVVTALTVPLTLSAPAQAAQPQTATGDQSEQVVHHGHAQRLANASLVRMRGTPTGDGGCTFTIPELTLRPGEHAIAARQVSTNYTDCSTLVEIGTPASRATTPTDGSRETALAAATGTADAGINATSSSGYYRLWWEDVVNIDVHSVKVNISWVWDGICVGASSGSVNYWWRSGTGWYKYSNSQWGTSNCTASRMHSNAEYRNGSFCPWGTVRSRYEDAFVEGRWSGVLTGGIGSTPWTTYPEPCPHLHYHSELVRVT